MIDRLLRLIGLKSLKVEEVEEEVITRPVTSKEREILLVIQENIQFNKSSSYSATLTRMTNRLKNTFIGYPLTSIVEDIISITAHLTEQSISIVSKEFTHTGSLDDYIDTMITTIALYNRTVDNTDNIINAYYDVTTSLFINNLRSVKYLTLPE